MTRIAAFDFDGTITREDSFLAFLRFVGGSARLYAVLCYYAPLLILMRLHLYSNHKAKEKVFARYFKHMALADFDNLCQSFYEQRGTHLIRPQILQVIQHHRQKGDKIIIITASLENWVQHFADHIGADVLIATQPEVVNGRLTGRFSTANCYGKEKVTRLLQLFPNRKQYYLIAYGDSRGDKELLQLADEAHLLK